MVAECKSCELKFRITTDKKSCPLCGGKLS